ncbi:MAG: hypothetical protein AAF385_09085 [Pseudomonadota bacterium]
MRMVIILVPIMATHRENSQSTLPRAAATKDPSSRRRYLLCLDNLPGLERIEILDTDTGGTSIVWQGRLARELLDSNYLGCTGLGSKVLPCSKTMVWHLALAAAGINVALRRQRKTDLCQLHTRLTHLGLDLPNPHRHIALTLFEQSNVHFSHEELLCLFELESPFLSNARCTDCLSDLVTWRVIQKIEVAKVGVFYDSNTEPHLHVFDEQTGTLYDAPPQGVIKAINLHRQ